MINLVQDVYIDKLAKDYCLNIKEKVQTSLSYQKNLMTPYEGVVDQARVRIYRQKVGSLCYSAIITRPDIAKTASKLAEFLINPGSLHLKAADHCLQYLHFIKYLDICYSASESEELTIKIMKYEKFERSHVFETTVDVSYANEAERRSVEDFIFKLFDDLIDWTARKQAIVSTSTIKTKLLALLHAEKEFL